MRMSGGCAASRAARRLGVSPVRTPTARGTLPGVAAPRDAGERRAEVALDVVGERLERRHVQSRTAARVRRRRLRREAVERPQERGQRLAAAGGRRDQRVGAGGDGRPALDLRRRGLRERAREPLTDLRREGRESGMYGWRRHVHCGCPRAGQASHDAGTEGERGAAWPPPSSASRDRLRDSRLRVPEDAGTRASP